MKCLLIAEAANPEWVSVPLVGWSHARALAEVSDAHLVTQVRNRDAILRAGLTEGEDFTAIDSELVDAPLYRLASALRGGAGKGWTTTTAISSLSYYYFEHLVWKKFGRRIRDGEFDVVHRITPLSPTAPSLIAGKCKKAGVPFILGPLNGGVPWPKQFDSARRHEKEWLSYVRSAYKLLPGYRSTRRNASAIIIGSQDTWKQMPERYHDKCVYVPENAIDPARFKIVRSRRAERPLRVIFVGRLTPYKGADMLLEAAALLVKEGLVHVKFIGDGPQMSDLRSAVEREGLADGVELSGWVEHSRVQEHLAEADVFAFPSIREFGGGVVLEAMATGLMPVVVNYGGPAELVSEKTGYLVDMASRESIVSQFRSILGDLARDPSPIEQKAAAASRRARDQFTWQAKAAQVLEVYEWVTGRREDKPWFGMPLPDSEEEHEGNGIV